MNNNNITSNKDILFKKRAYERLNLIFGENNFTEIDPLLKNNDTYAEVLTAFGYINNSPAYVFSQDIDRDFGAMSSAQISKICKLYDLASKTGYPIIGIYDSIGAKIGEYNSILQSYGNLLLKVNNLSGLVPQISIILGSCLGSNALLASCSDFVIMSKNAKFGIETNAKNSSCDFAVKAGNCHFMTKNDEHAINIAKQLVSILPSNNLSYTNIDKVKPSYELDIKNSEKYSQKETIISLFDDSKFLELQSEFGQTISIGFSKLEGRTVCIAISNSNVNNGILDSKSCTKLARIASFCDAFSIPLITFIESKGFESLKDAAKLSNVYAEATNVKITIITGSIYGSTYIALGSKGSNSDITFAWESAIISALLPEASIEILYEDRIKNLKNPLIEKPELIKEYINTHASPYYAAEQGYIDDVISIDGTRVKLCYTIEMLCNKRVQNIPKKHSNIQV